MATKKKTAPKKKPAPKPKTNIVSDELEQEVNRRADAEHNLIMIWAKFLEISTKKMRWPSLSELAKATGLSKTTVFNHLKEHKGEMEALREKYAIFSDMAMFKLGVNAAQGKSEKWSELFFKVVHGIGDKKQVDITSGGKRIGGVDLSQLSDEELIALKSIKQKVNAE
jgi:hypothetical protein